jgi:hypothetical protein
MHKITSILLLLLVAAQCPGGLSAQEKFEKESRIKSKEVPPQALSFIRSLNSGSKVKWYKEEGLHASSFEAKFKRAGTSWSVEFDTLGNVEDVELETNWEDLPAGIRNAITSTLNKDCTKHAIGKIQLQFTGIATGVFPLDFENGAPGLTLRYELIVRCGRQKNTAQYEYLFNEAGATVSISRIVFKNSSHLEY